MLKIECNKEYTIEGFKTGESSRGAWALCTVKAEKGYDRITIWADNPTHSSLDGANYVKVLSISSAVLSAKQKDGKWYPQYSVNATVEGIRREAPGKGEFMALPPAGSDEDLPFSF